MAAPAAGAAVPLCYGYAWATGQKIQSTTLENTGNVNLDYTRIGFWLLGEGEWDGLDEMWDTGLGRLLYTSETADPNTLHFHSGCDAYKGGGSALVSTGGDQNVDAFWSNLPPGLQPLHYNRWAYYAIKLKQLINNPPNTNQDDPSVWADVNPIGLWRTMRCRIFDASGAMVGYAFTRNPAWHYVDLLCRRKLFPEYNIDVLAGPDDLPTAVRNRFDWVALANSAAYYNQKDAQGFPLFSGDYSFTQRSSLQACLTQIATSARSFNRERNGQFALIADQARASVFTFSRKNADSFRVTDEDVHTAANVQIAQFRDILAPAFATIASISCPDRQSPVVTTQKPHCAVANDLIVIGNTGTLYDGNWVVASVPAPDGSGNVYQMTLKNKGSNYPSAVGAGGLIGFRYSRFKSRSPLFQHHAHQLARGAVGVGIQRQRNKVSTTTDFANSTWDQVSRIAQYMNGTTLGPDVQPYVNPKRATLRAPFFAADAAGSGAVAGQIEPGDVVTIDDTLDATYAGAWEVTKEQIAVAADPTSAAGASVDLTLRPYSAANYPDTTTTSEPGWPDVPMLPGGDSRATLIPLQDGDFAFFSGSGADGDSFPMPDGYSPNFMLAWASPQGFIEGDQHLHNILDCDAYQSRKLALQYIAAGVVWTGDVNYSGVAWRTQNSASSFYYQGIAYIEFTLLGGEKILFGKGWLPSGAQLGIPPGYDSSKVIVLGLSKNAPDSGNPAHGFCAYVDNNGMVHHTYKDNSGNTWEGNANIFIFGFQNNMGTWKKQNGWFYCPLPNPGGNSFIPGGGAQPGLTLAVAGFSILDPGCAGTTPTVYNAGVLTEVLTGGVVPAMPNLSSKTLQIMTGPNGFQVTPNDCHGVRQCFVDADLNSTANFEDGDGNIWYGSAGVFGLLYDQPTGDPGGTPPPGGGTQWPGAGAPGGGGGGGSDTGGGGNSLSACTVRGTPLSTPEGDLSNEEIKRRVDAREFAFLNGRELPERVVSAEWIWVPGYWRVEVDGYAAFGASDSHPMKVAGEGYRWLRDIADGAMVETLGGDRRLRKIYLSEEAEVLRLELAGPSHEYCAVGGVWGHNHKVLSTAVQLSPPPS
jgi:hypothetical protein